LLDSDLELKPTYVVYRTDSIQYSGEDIEVVLKDENSEYQKITALDITCEEEGEFFFELRFNNRGKYSNGVSLSISGHDTDFVHLLFSDVRQYIENEVAVLNPLKLIRGDLSAWVTVIMSLAAFALLIAVMLLVSQSNGTNLSDDNINSILSSSDINTKLNYLIERNTIRHRITISKPVVFVIAGILTALVLSSRFIRKQLVRFFPSNVFAIGKGKERYKRMLELRSKIVWGVVVAFFVSGMAGLVIYFVTRQ
jgi:hypothetical protein